jgi:DNA invertase Pin-like site-specific DNA recombinase
MPNRFLIYVPRHCNRMSTSAEYIDRISRTVESRGDLSVEMVAGTRRKHNVGQKSLIANLAGVDQVAVASAADLPARTVKDLLRLLGTLRDHGVGLLLTAEGIDTSSGSAFTVLDIIDEFRRTKLSRAIRAGQAKALAAGKTIGRPKVNAAVRDRILAYVAAGSGIRPTANKFGVAPGTVINICRLKSISLGSQTVDASDQVARHQD